jgi:hypothetical protein
MLGTRPTNPVGAGRFRTGDARPSAGAGIIEEDGAGPMSHPSGIYAINAPIRPAHPEIVPGRSRAKRAEFGVGFFSQARVRVTRLRDTDRIGNCAELFWRQPI